MKSIWLSALASAGLLTLSGATLAADIPEQHEDLARKAISILTRPELAPIFGPDSRPEVPFLAPAHRDGKPILLAGRIDRLVVTPQSVIIVDFKSDAVAPADPAAVPASYLTQLALYAMVANQLFAGRAVKTAILWTGLESLMELAPEQLVSAARSFTID